MDEIPEIRLAVFGASLSGKTTLLASYYGNQQRHSFEEAHGYRLEAEDVSDGNSLLKHYYRMEAGEFPLGTGAFTEHRFNFKLRARIVGLLGTASASDVVVRNLADAVRGRRGSE